MRQTLVFDWKFTKCAVLNDLSKEGIRFITLCKRTKKIVEQIISIPEENWQKMDLGILKRKCQKVEVYEQKIRLAVCTRYLSQITIKDHGREKPILIITNDNDLSIKAVLEVYAKRWRVENKISELMPFFNLNALSSPLMIRIAFDMPWSMIADTLYHIFAQDLRRFEDNLSPTIFRKFIDFTGKVKYNGEMFQVKIRKKAHTPILKDIKELQ